MSIIQLILALLGALQVLAQNDGFWRITYPFVLDPPDAGTAAGPPCGGADMNTQSGGARWSSAGSQLGLLITIDKATFEFRGMSVDHKDQGWRSLAPDLEQVGAGHACVMLPGITAWDGSRGFIQVAFDGASGETQYQVSPK